MNFEAAEVEYRASSERLDPWQYVAFYNLAYSMLAQSKVPGAIENFRISLEMKSDPLDYGLADALIVAGQYDRARELLESGQDHDSPIFSRNARTKMLNLHAELGELDEAFSLVNDLIRDSTDPTEKSALLVAKLAIVHRMNGDVEQVFNEAVSFEQQRISDEANILPNEKLTHLAILARVGLRYELRQDLSTLIGYVEESAVGNGFPIQEALYELLLAEIFLQASQGMEAIQAIERSFVHAELFEAHVMMARANELVDDESGRDAELDWIIRNKGRAFSEMIDWGYGNLSKIFEWADTAKEIGARTELLVENEPLI